MDNVDPSNYSLANTTHNQCNRAQLNALLRRYELSNLKQYVDINNPSRHLPYHNNQHMQEVALNAVKLYRMEEDNGELPCSLGPRADEMTLLIAGLFHDYGHSGGLLPDHANIAMACEMLKAYVSKYEPNIPARVLADAIDLIKVTEFPFVHEPKTSLQRIFRDADLLGFLEADGPVNVIHGLRLEMNVKAEKPLSQMEMYERQVQYVDNIKLFTKSAQQLWTASARYQLAIAHHLAQVPLES